MSPQTDWRAASSESFFELFCSVGRQAFDVHRDKCTVTLASSTPQRWAVHAVVHRECGPKPRCGEGLGGDTGVGRLRGVYQSPVRVCFPWLALSHGRGRGTTDEFWSSVQP